MSQDGRTDFSCRYHESVMPICGICFLDGYFGSVDNGGHSLITEKIFVGKTSSGFPEDINRVDEVTLTSVSCVQPRLNAQIY